MRLKVLVLAPHVDDGELGCGATISKFIGKGDKVHYVAFSICEESILEGFPKNIMEVEVKKATKILGIDEKNLVVKKYPVRHFPEYRQEILDDLIKLKDEINPDLVFLPSSFDVHQDHVVVHQEGLRAFKHCNMFGYEFMWNNYSFNTTSFVIFEEKNLTAKINALKQYKSQKHRIYNSAESLKGLASYRGLQVGSKYAESFEVIRWIIR